MYVLLGTWNSKQKLPVIFGFIGVFCKQISIGSYLEHIQRCPPAHAWDLVFPLISILLQVIHVLRDVRRNNTAEHKVVFGLWKPEESHRILRDEINNGN